MRRDGDGYYYVVDRKKEMIKYKVSVLLSYSRPTIDGYGRDTKVRHLNQVQEQEG